MLPTSARTVVQPQGSVVHNLRWLGLAAIFLLALFLRTYSLHDAGFLYGDESAYYGGPATMAAAARWWFSDHAMGQSLFETVLTAHGTTDSIAGRPIMGLISFAWLFALGPNPAHLLLMNAWLGALTVGVVFLIGRKLWPSGPEAWLGALMLAVSGFHLIWSRNAFAHCLATAWLALGVLSYLKALWRPPTLSHPWIFVAGLCTGAGLATHHLFVYYAAALVVFEIMRTLQARTLRAGLYNFLLAGFGTFVVLVTMQVLTSLPNLLPHEFTSTSRTTYWDTFLAMVKETAGYNMNTWKARLSGYFWMPFVYGEGILASFIFAVGLCMVVVRLASRGLGSSSPEALLLCLTLVPLAVMMLVDGPPQERNLAPLCPWVALVGAVVLAALWRAPKARYLRSPLIVAFVGMQVLHSAYLFDIRSGYAAAAEWLGGRDGSILRVPPNGRETLWYTNGVMRLSLSPLPEADEHGQVPNIFWHDASSVQPGERVYIGLADIRPESQLNPDWSWLEVLRGLEPLQLFTHTDPFTAKKLDLLQQLQRPVRALGWRRLQRLLEFHQHQTETLIQIRSIAIYAWPNAG